MSMAIRQIEDAKVLRSYCRKLGRQGVAERIIEIAHEIVKGEGAYQSTIIAAGKIRALAVACKEDSYWDEKQSHGFTQMVYEAKRETRATCAQ